MIWFRTEKNYFKLWGSVLTFFLLAPISAQSTTADNSQIITENGVRYRVTREKTVVGKVYSVSGKTVTILITKADSVKAGILLQVDGAAGPIVLRADRGMHTNIKASELA